MLRNQKGYTMIELIGVMVILAVVVAIGIKHYRLSIKFSETTAAITACADLNSRETGQWAGTLISGGYKTDENVWLNHEDYLSMTTGNRSWVSLTQDGGTLMLNGTPAVLNRERSTLEKPAFWSPL